MSDIKSVLREVYRIMSKDGIFAFSCPNEHIPENTLRSLLKNYDYPLIDRLDRGRDENWRRHAKTREEWEIDIKQAGFKVVQYKKFHSSLQIGFGETWLRTLQGSYQILYNRLLPEQSDIWLEFKRNWVKELMTLLSPFADEKWLKKQDDNMLYHSFLIQKV